MSNMIHTEIEINAPPTRVMNILLDFPSFPKWHNGFITQIALIPQTESQNDNEVDAEAINTPPPRPLPEPKEGDTLTGIMGGVNFTATIIELTPQTLTWTGPPLYNLFRGTHTFHTLPSTVTPGATTFVQEESFSGIAAWVFSEEGVVGRWLGVGGMVRGYFEGFNADVKREAERRRGEGAVGDEGGRGMSDDRGSAR